MKFLTKTISAIMAFIMLLSSGSSDSSVQKCKPEFNGTFIQSWLTASWDDKRWEAETRNMKQAGIEYLVLQTLAEKGSNITGGKWTVYYKSGVKALEKATFAGDSLEPALRHCKKAGIKVFVGLNMFDDFWTEGTLTKQYGEVCDIAAEMVEDIHQKYGNSYSETLYGWYFAPEISNGIIRQFNVQGLADGLNDIIESINKTDESKPLLLSPFYSEYLSTGSLVTLATYVRLFDLVNLRNGDIFAPQDAVGAKWVKEENLEMTWKLYKTAVETCDADIKLWANCENFSSAVAGGVLSGIVSPPQTENVNNVPETLDRFVWQMNVASHYAENIITFSYNHYYSPDYVNPVFNNTYLDYIENGYVLENSAPSKVKNPAVSLNGSKLVLSWEGAEDNIGIAYYRVLKDGKFFTRVEAKGNETLFTVTDSAFANNSTYTVTAFDGAGNSSEATTFSK